MTAILENDRLRVAVLPDYGARVTSLVDKRTGREWIAQGPESPNTGEDAEYAGDEAVGWDECFPTVTPWDASHTAWGRKLRDHGDLWGRPFDIDGQTSTTLRLSYADPQFRFTRELQLDGATLVARYEVENRTDTSLPYLWALHGLLAVTEADRIELPEVETVAATYLSLGDTFLSVPELPWSKPSDVLPFTLDKVQPAASVFAGKFYAAVPGRTARVGRPGQWLTLAWGAPIDQLGIWLTYGGWPGPGGHHEIALEPTNAAADTLGEAIDAGAKPLAPGERRAWHVTLSLTS
jgi:galactose mutarotase-like enzyme